MSSARRSVSKKLQFESLEDRNLMAGDVPSTLSSAMDLGMVNSTAIIRSEAIGTASDVDMYKFSISAGQRVGFDIDTPTNGPGGLGSYLRLFDANGRELAANNDQLAPDEPSTGAEVFDSYIGYDLSVPGTYFIGVSNWQNSLYNPITGATQLGSDTEWLTGGYQLNVTGTASDTNAPDNVKPLQIAPQSDGSLIITYGVTNTVSSRQSIPVSIYWGSGGTGLGVIPQPSSPAIFTFDVRENTNPGTYVFTVPKESLTTAPPGATHLVVVANPAENLASRTSSEAILAQPARLNNLTATQLQKIMPRLSLADATRYVGPLNQAMLNSGINTLEQRAMFLAQINHESENLTSWSEKFNGTSAKNYFIQKYWVSRDQWTGLGASIPNASGITLRIPAGFGTPTTKNFKLYFANGEAFANKTRLEATVTFRKVGGFYEAHFSGAEPPRLTSHLLIVDPMKNNKVVSAIRNNLGNWRPIDASDFRGRGPMQITGRYNYQLFANYASSPTLMKSPVQLSNSLKPEFGFSAAGWFWQGGNPHRNNMNQLTNSLAGSNSVDFNREITRIINPGFKGVDDRLMSYRRIRATLLSGL